MAGAVVAPVEPNANLPAAAERLHKLGEPADRPFQSGADRDGALVYYTREGSMRRLIGLAVIGFVLTGAGFRNRPVDCANELRHLVGWTIVATKTIDGEFEGCDYDRIISFLDGTRLRCSEYGYTYSYMPEAVLFAKSVTYQGKELRLIKMLVEDELYDMSVY